MRRRWWKPCARGGFCGAGLDVYEQEPELSPGLVELENVVLLPHVGSATIETRTRMAFMAAENLLVGLRGERSPELPQLGGALRRGIITESNPLRCRE